MLPKKSMILLFSLMLSGGFVKSNVGENKFISKKTNKVQIEPNAAHNALIIKSTEDCNIQIIDECGQTVINKNVDRGTNQLELKNVKSANYKIVVSNEAFSVIRNLSVQ